MSLQHILQLSLRGSRHGCGKIRQSGRFIGTEVFEKNLQLFPVQWVQGNKFLNDVDDGDRVCLDFGIGT